MCSFIAQWRLDTCPFTIPVNLALQRYLSQNYTIFWLRWPQAGTHSCWLTLLVPAQSSWSSSSAFHFWNLNLEGWIRECTPFFSHRETRWCIIRAAAHANPRRLAFALRSCAFHLVNSRPKWLMRYLDKVVQESALIWYPCNCPLLGPEA